MGRWNVFEEYMVRKFTDNLLGGDVPENLDALFDGERVNLENSMIAGWRQTKYNTFKVRNGEEI